MTQNQGSTKGKIAKSEFKTYIKVQYTKNKWLHTRTGKTSVCVCVCMSTYTSYILHSTANYLISNLSGKLNTCTTFHLPEPWSPGQTSLFSLLLCQLSLLSVVSKVIQEWVVRIGYPLLFLKRSSPFRSQGEWDGWCEIVYTGVVKRSKKMRTSVIRRVQQALVIKRTQSWLWWKY